MAELSVKLRIGPEAGALTARVEGRFPAEIDYQQVIESGSSPPDPDLNSITQSERVELDENLSATVELANVAAPSKINIRFLAADGSRKLEKSSALSAATQPAEIAISLSPADVTALLAPERSLPATPTAPKVVRAGHFVTTSEAEVPFARSKLFVATLATAEDWGHLGLGKLFQSEAPITSAVEFGGIKWDEIGKVGWQNVHLGVDGRFEAKFDKGSGIGWLWWLSGPRAAVGAMSGDGLDAPRLRLAIPLPAFPAAPAGEPSLPEPQSPCRGVVPANPTEVDLARNPEIYAEDPGAFCQPFSVPNRVVSERSFATVVRVEQPEIGSLPSARMTSISLLALEPAEATPATAEPRAGGRAPASTPTPASPVTGPSKLWSVGLPTRFTLPTSFTKAIAKLGSGRSLVGPRNPVQWEDDSCRYQAASVARGHILEFRVRWRSNGYSLGTVAKTLTLAPRQTKRIQKIEWERYERARRDERTQLRDEVRDETLRERTYDDEVSGSFKEWARGESHAETASVSGGIGFAMPPVVAGPGGGGSTADSWSQQDGARATTVAEEQRLRDSIRRHGDALRRLESTVVTEVTQQETVTGTTEIIRNPNYGHSLTVIYYQILRHLRVDTEFAGVRECLFIPFAITPFAIQRAHRWRDALRRGMKEPRFARALAYLKDVLTKFATSDIPEGMRAIQPIRALRGSLYLTLAIDRPRDKEDGSYDEAKWQVLNRFVGSPVFGIRSRLAALVEALRDAAFQRDDAPGIAANWVDTLQLQDEDGNLLDADFTLATQYGFKRAVRVDFTASGAGPTRASVLTRAKLETLKLVATHALPPGSVANLTGLKFTYATDHFERTVSGGTGVNDLVKPITGEIDKGAIALAPLSAWEKVDQRNEMRQAVVDLIEHLNEHVEYYHKVIWWHMDRDRLYMMLDGFYVPGTKDVSIASVVEKQPVAIIGNALVFPVSAGAFLGLGEITTPDLLYSKYKDTQPPRDPLHIALPTDGLYAQTVMDPCLALEEHGGNIDWVLGEQEPDLGVIAPELMMSRRADTAAATKPTEFPQTIINLQNAPEAPAVTGLAGMLQALGKADAFRDMAGLAGTQAGAQAALQTAAGLASSFGAQVAALKIADMAAKAQATQNADKQLATVQRALDKGVVTKEEAGQHGNEILKQLHTPDVTPAAPSYVKEIADAIKGGGKFERTDAAGTVKMELAGADAAAGGAGGRPWIIAGPDLTVEARAFHPARGDKSGRVRLSVRVREADMPAGGSIRWSVSPQTAVEPGQISLAMDPAVQHNTHTGDTVDVMAVHPGLTKLGVALFDNGGTRLESMSLPISVPQFITVSVIDALFDPILTGYQLGANKTEVLLVAKEVVDHLLNDAHANVRTIWTIPGFGAGGAVESLPAQFMPGGLGANNVTTAKFEGNPPRPGLLGWTRGPLPLSLPGQFGPNIPNEQISVYIGGFDDPNLVPNPTDDIDEITMEVVNVLASPDPMSSPIRDKAIAIMGRLLGETLAHEIGHSLIGTTLTSAPHNDHNAAPGLPGDIMNQGGDRLFRSRTGFEILEPISTPDLSQLTDHTIGTINRFLNRGLFEIRAHFRVPPDFT